MELFEYMRNRTAEEVNVQLEIARKMAELSKRIKNIEEENESINDTLDVLMTDIIPNLEG